MNQAMQIEITGLSKRYWLQPVLQDLDLTIAPGQIMAVVGINGAGKSTLLRCLATLLAWDKGEIRFDGERLSRDRVDLRRRLHLVSDSPPKPPNVDMITQIAFILRAYGDMPPGIEGTIADLIVEFGMEDCEYMPLQTLSRGQVYKAALISMIALDRELWLLDEPLGSGMDPRGLTALRRHVRAAASRGRTIVYTTQLLEMVWSFADSVGVLSRGRLKRFGSLAEIKSAEGEDHALLAELTDALPGES
jgi:ABC-2 type transport system ATP-binding protein